MKYIIYAILYLVLIYNCYNLLRDIRKRNQLGKLIHINIHKFNTFHFYLLLLPIFLLDLYLIKESYLLTIYDIAIMTAAVFAFIGVIIYRAISAPKIYMKGIMVFRKVILWDEVISYQWDRNNDEKSYQLILRIDYKNEMTRSNNSFKYDFTDNTKDIIQKLLTSVSISNSTPTISR